MRENYGIIHGWVGISEGGFVNHKDDPGGATNYGVTQKTFDRWRKSRDEPTASVRNLSHAEALQIIEFQFFDKVAADRLPSGLDYATADYSVNSGPAKAAKDLQRVVGVPADGVIGVQTLAAVRAMPTEDVIRQLCERRWAFMQSLKHFDSFKSGWRTRVWGEEMGVQDGDIGVVDRATRMAHKAKVIPMPTKATPGRAEGKGNGLRGFWNSLKAAA